MKTVFINLVLLLSFLILTTSCSKESSNETNSDTPVGKWMLMSYEISNFENTGTTVDDWKKLTSRPVLEFKNDGTLIDNLISGNSRQMKYTVIDKKITFELSLAFETHNSFTFSISGSTLTLKREDKYSTFTETTTIVLKRI